VGLWGLLFFVGEQKPMKRQTLVFALAAILAGPSAFAVTDAQLKAIKKSLNSVPVPELPAKAAELVTQAAKEDRETVAITVVRTAIRKSRSSAPLVVSAVSKAAPEVAAPVSRVAAEMESGQAESISAAAVGAAPQAKTQIVSSVHQGVYGSMSSSTVTVPSASAYSEAAITPVTFTARGSADTVHGNGNGVNRGNQSHHSVPPGHDPDHDGRPDFADGNRGRFPTSPPHTIPPGHDPNHHGRPDFVDYTKPRHF
jgi:hypothetical protein